MDAETLLLETEESMLKAVDFAKRRNSPAYARAKPPPASWKTWTYMSPATAPS